MIRGGELVPCGAPHRLCDEQREADVEMGKAGNGLKEGHVLPRPFEWIISDSVHNLPAVAPVDQTPALVAADELLR